MFLLLLLPLSLYAQVNDMFYVPKKEVKQKDVVKILSAEDDEWGVADNGNNRDVDEYNRRGKVVPRNSASKADEVYVDDTYYVDEAYNEEDYTTEYDYSTRIVRFHNPVSIVLSPWHWDIYYPTYYYYDGFWGSHWDVHWHYGFNYSWNRPLGYYSWHKPFPPAHFSHSNVRHNTARRIPVTSVRPSGSSQVRVPVAGNKKPASKEQVTTNKRGGGGKTTGRVPGTGKVSRDKNKGGEKRGGNVQNNNRREPQTQKREPSSTYNRRSSTSVKSSSSPSHRPSGGGRTPVSRGGASRGGRR